MISVRHHAFFILNTNQSLCAEKTQTVTIMKRLFLLVASIAIATCANAQTATLSNGKNIPVRLTSEVQSNAKVQSTPTAIVDADIKDDSNQHILIRRGTPVEVGATIRKAKGVGKGAYVKLDFISTTSVDGQTIRLQGNLIREGADKKGTALGVGLGVGLTVCWPCLFCLCIKGEKVTIPENTMAYNVVTNDIYQIDID